MHDDRYDRIPKVELHYGLQRFADQSPNPKSDPVEHQLLPKRGVGGDDRLAMTLARPFSLA